MIGSPLLTRGLDPVRFYGDSHSTIKVDSGNTRKPLIRHTTLLGPSAEWRTFKKQQEVLDFVAESNLNLYPFTFEDNVGNRRFLAVHPETFWQTDDQRHFNERHSYEIIRENKPCKLYFDIEFETAVNEHRDGDRMVNTFINLVCIALKNQYGVQCAVSDVLILDSTSPSKFSCHLIFPNVIFENNYHVGYFVKRLCYEIEFLNIAADLKLLINVLPSDEVNELFILNSKGRRKLFCDEAVYTKNRHFRLYKSSKSGKNVPLRISDNNQFQVSGELDTFLHSLITYCPQVTSRLTYADEDFPLSVPRRTHCSRRRCESTTINPFVEIDQCISVLARPGSIYRSRYFPEKRTLVYDIVGNRFCANIGRQHKSNNIKYVVDVNTLSWYQRCYDPDCADFRSASHKLPVDESIFINHDIDDADFLLLDYDRELGEKLLSYQNPLFSSADNEDDSCELLNRSFGKALFFQDADEDLMANVAEKCEASALLNAEDPDEQLMVSAAEECETTALLKDEEQDEQLMVFAAEECESHLLRGKRKLSEHLSTASAEQMNDEDEDRHDKRKVIRRDDLPAKMTESTESINRDGH